MALVPRTLRSTKWCAAEPGTMLTQTWVPALRRTAEEALHRVRDTRKLSA